MLIQRTSMLYARVMYIYWFNCLFNGLKYKIPYMNVYLLIQKHCIMKPLFQWLIIYAITSTCLAFSIAPHSAADHETFVIQGRVSGFANGTILYFEPWTDPTLKFKDSALVTDGSFVFRGTYAIKKPPFRVIIRTKDYSDYYVFWLEGSTLSFTAQKGQFRKTIIKGSPLQEKQQEYYASIAGEEDQIERIKSVLRRGDHPDSTQMEDSIPGYYIPIINEKTEKFIHDNPNLQISAELLNSLTGKIEKSRIEELYQRLAEPLKLSKKGKVIAEFLALNQSIQLGGKYVDLEQVTPDGKKVRLSEIKGKYVLLEFWNSLCIPCRRENPELVQLYRRFKDQGFEIYAVSNDEHKSMWKKAIEKDQLPWINVSDDRGVDNVAFSIYGIYQYPSNYLINPKGVIIAKDLRREKLKEKLEEIFGK